MIVVMGYLRFTDGDIEKLRPALHQQLTNTRAEDGCEHYAYSVDVLDPNLLIINERWRDSDSMTAHMKSSNVAIFRAYLESHQIKSIGASITAYNYEADDIRRIM